MPSGQARGADIHGSIEGTPPRPGQHSTARQNRTPPPPQPLRGASRSSPLAPPGLRGLSPTCPVWSSSKNGGASRCHPHSPHSTRGQGRSHRGGGYCYVSCNIYVNASGAWGGLTKHSGCWGVPVLEAGMGVQAWAGRLPPRPLSVLSMCPPVLPCDRVWVLAPTLTT